MPELKIKEKAVKKQSLQRILAEQSLWQAVTKIPPISQRDFIVSN